MLHRAAVGGTTGDLLRTFDSLPAASADSMLGRWRGSGLPSGHPMDGLLERFGWFGKQFDAPDEVHPLLCRTRNGSIFALNPALVPMSLMNRHIGLFHNRAVAALFAVAGRLAATRRPAARLRMTEHRGVVTATMIYDRLPINDMFRTIDAHTRLGLMDLRDMPQPFFFILTRADAA